jgi:uncharacterized SAM-dependent methyltransferase
MGCPVDSVCGLQKNITSLPPQYFFKTMDRESVEREHAQLKREAALERGRVSESANT